MEILDVCLHFLDYALIFLKGPQQKYSFFIFFCVIPAITIIYKLFLHFNCNKFVVGEMYLPTYLSTLKIYQKMYFLLITITNIFYMSQTLFPHLLPSNENCFHCTVCQFKNFHFITSSLVSRNQQVSDIKHKILIKFLQVRFSILNLDGIV